LIFVFTLGLTPFLKTDFLGASGSDSIVANQTLSPGATLADKSAAALKLEKAIVANKDVEVVLTTIGTTGDGRVAFGGDPGGISHQITVKKGAELADLQKKVEKIVADDSSLGTLKFASGGGPAFGGSSTVDVKLTAKTDEALEAGIVAVEKAMKGTANVSEITNSLATKQRTLKVTVDRMAAARAGLSEIAIGGIVSGAMQPMSIGSLNVKGIATDIYVIGADKPLTIDEVKAISIPTMTGPVRLSSVADVVLTKVPVSITSEKGDRTARVSLTPEGDNLGAITVDVTSRLEKVELPAGVTATIGGLSSQQAESFGQLGLALLAGILLVFLVMVATFRSIRQPLILLVSIPFAATGALSMLLLTNTSLDISAIIGMLLLVGIVVTNAIVLIDLINQYRKEGRDIHTAIMDGARQRLRPILMTALATIFALTPMALGFTGGGGFISQPLAIVVIGGLFSSTVLTLVIVPTLYWIIEGGQDRKLARLAKKA